MSSRSSTERAAVTRLSVVDPGGHLGPPVPSGVAALRSAVRLAASRPGDVARLAGRPGPVLPTSTQFARTVSNTTEPAEAVALYDHYVISGYPWPALRALIRTSRGRGPARRSSLRRGPLLLAGGGRDLVVHEARIEALQRYYRRSHPDSVTDIKVFPDHGHSLAMDSGWRSVAFY